jgi:nucleoside-diphosphate-sugar epimerase
MLNKKILITGGAGFIGYNLSKSLVVKKYSIQIIYKEPINFYKKKFNFLKKSSKFSYKQIDLSSQIKNKFFNFSHAFHLAASLGVKNIDKNPYKAFKNNINSLINLIDNLKKNSPNCILIYFSSSEVYSPLVEKNKVKIPTEEDIDLLINKNIINRDSYYLSKLLGEKILQLSGLKYVILRPHNVYGPFMGYRHVISELIKKMSNDNKKKTKNVKIFSPNHTRSFCYIDDAINQITNISFNKKSLNKIINIGNSKDEIKIYKLAELIKYILKSNIVLKKGEITPGSPSRRVPDMKKNIKITNLKRLVSLKDGIKKTIDWAHKKSK